MTSATTNLLRHLLWCHHDVIEAMRASLVELKVPPENIAIDQIARTLKAHVVDVLGCDVRWLSIAGSDVEFVPAVHYSDALGGIACVNNQGPWLGKRGSFGPGDGGTALSQAWGHASGQFWSTQWSKSAELAPAKRVIEGAVRCAWQLIASGLIEVWTRATPEKSPTKFDPSELPTSGADYDFQSGRIRLTEHADLRAVELRLPFVARPGEQILLIAMRSSEAPLKNSQLRVCLKGHGHALTYFKTWKAAARKLLEQENPIKAASYALHDPKKRG